MVSRADTNERHSLRTHLLRFSNSIVWRLPGSEARKLFRFSCTELGGMLDLCAAANLTENRDRQAAYLRHFLDEKRHAQMFLARYRTLFKNPTQAIPKIPNVDHEHLFERLGETRFLAFVHRAEKRGRLQFETYRDWFARRQDHKGRALFDGILQDEHRHEIYTRELLTALSGDERTARKELRGAAAWAAWRHWRRIGRFTAEVVYVPLMLLFYFIMTPILFATAATRRHSSGWTQPQIRPGFDTTGLGGHSTTK